MRSLRSRAAATYSSSRSPSTAARTVRAMTGAKTKPTTRMIVTFDGPSEVIASSADDDDRERQERLDEAAEDVVDRAAEVAGDEAERGAEHRARAGSRAARRSGCRARRR